MKSTQFKHIKQKQQATQTRHNTANLVNSTQIKSTQTNSIQTKQKQKTNTSSHVKSDQIKSDQIKATQNTPNQTNTIKNTPELDQNKNRSTPN